MDENDEEQTERNYYHIFAIVILVIAIVSGFLVSSNSSHEIAIELALPYWIAGALLCIFIFGLGTIIDNQKEIIRKLDNLEKKKQKKS